MDKAKIIRGIHKILFVFEENNYEGYYSYLTHQTVKLSEYENEVISQNIRLLKGLRNMGEEVVHFDVRQTIIHIMNDLNRRL